MPRRSSAHRMRVSKPAVLQPVHQAGSRSIPESRSRRQCCMRICLPPAGSARPARCNRRRRARPAPGATFQLRLNQPVQGRQGAPPLGPYLYGVVLDAHGLSSFRSPAHIGTERGKIVACALYLSCAIFACATKYSAPATISLRRASHSVQFRRSTSMPVGLIALALGGSASDSPNSSSWACSPRWPRISG